MGIADRRRSIVNCRMSKTPSREHGALDRLRIGFVSRRAFPRNSFRGNPLREFQSGSFGVRRFFAPPISLMLPACGLGVYAAAAP
jgi:hypothetical protein